MLTDTLQLFRHINYPLQLLIFPEGTDLSEYNRCKDYSYAEQNGLCHYEYVMHPRTTGFVHCAQQLAWSGTVRVCDVTVGYLGAMPQNESNLLAGKPILCIWFSSISIYIYSFLDLLFNFFRGVSLGGVLSCLTVSAFCG